MKRQASDPWDTIAIDYTIGQLVQAVVTKLTKFGAFAQLVDVPEIEGLIHISELSDKRVTHPREVVNEGDKLTLRVVKIDIKDRRLGLSLKKVNSAEYLDLDWATSFSETTDSPSESGGTVSGDNPESIEESEGPTGDSEPTATEETVSGDNPESIEESEGPVEPTEPDDSEN
jgi:predicted RNA-binding protein with RPS1 domain